MKAERCDPLRAFALLLCANSILALLRSPVAGHGSAVRLQEIFRGECVAFSRKGAGRRVFILSPGRTELPLHAFSQTVVQCTEEPQKSLPPGSYGCCEGATMGQN